MYNQLCRCICRELYRLTQHLDGRTPTLQPLPYELHIDRSTTPASRRNRAQDSRAGLKTETIHVGSVTPKIHIVQTDDISTPGTGSKCQSTIHSLRIRKVRQ